MITQQPITVNEKMLLFPYLRLAQNAYNWSSFDPERRGKQTIRDYSLQLTTDLANVAKWNGDVNRYKNKYIDLFTSWLSSLSRCASPMITGRSNFPTRRNQKNNQYEHNAYQRFSDWREKALAAIEKNYQKSLLGTPIEETQKKVNEEQKSLDFMKAVNKIAKSRAKASTHEVKVQKLMQEFGMTEKQANGVLEPDFGGRVGFPPYALTNCRQRLKNAELRLKELERKEAATNKERTVNGVDILENYDDNRLQLFFEGKPSDEIRKILKSNGFRWSPKNVAWQAILTDNAKWKLDTRIIPLIEKI